MRLTACVLVMRKCRQLEEMRCIIVAKYQRAICILVVVNIAIALDTVN